MNLVVTYDVSTLTVAGKRRLRRVAKICEGYGQRVQYSVFEVTCSKSDLAKLLHKLEEVIESKEDSLRLYPIHSEDFNAVIRLGESQNLPHDQAWTL
ncbi:CRISPR-associated endonuclease Cas2 [Nocardioides sp. L-11A]|uniref:CRISPR-associated endonuclease Cas2 n=1 Tax=Nocardioides sp. L-11A TaxID=3043848 RepID=UPI00249B66AD|nr:CRISPR-associated endonuclease Cas2 [Nocardioides sp. L-11A]